MVTVINPPRPTKKSQTNGDGVNRTHASQRGGAGGSSSDGGGDSNKRKGGGDEGDNEDFQLDKTRMRYRLGTLVLLVTIVMMFASLTIAYVLTSGSSSWRPIQFPSQLWLSTLLIIASSVTLEFARRAWQREATRTAHRWLMTTAVLGICFIVSQVMSWRELAAQGLFLQTNPHSSFFYLLTGVHALHLIGGIFALGFLMFRVERRVAISAVQRQSALEAGALYWHFIDGLWVYVFLLLFLWQ